MSTEITLGGVTVPCPAQRHAYLEHRLGPAISGAIARGEGVGADGILRWLGDGVYDALIALIPALASRMPLWQFRGYGSADAYAAGEYDAELDQSPSLPEIKEAITVAMAVNGIDELVKLGKALIDPRMAKAQINAVIAEAIDSSTSPSTSGASASTSSSTSPPTSSASEDSPSLASPA